MNVCRPCVDIPYKTTSRNFCMLCTRLSHETAAVAITRPTATATSTAAAATTATTTTTATATTAAATTTTAAATTAAAATTTAATAVATNAEVLVMYWPYCIIIVFSMNSVVKLYEMIRQLHFLNAGQV